MGALPWLLLAGLLTFLAMEMEPLTPDEYRDLVTALATREGTGKEIAKWYGLTLDQLHRFVDENRGELEATREALATPQTSEDPSGVTPQQLDELWVTNKFERLKRYQAAADLLFKDIETSKLVGTDLSTSLREFRSYLTVVANELGQLLHRGSGESATGDTVSYDIQGIDMDTLR